ncbi:unnamed protein product [Cladocopium goreaui]|uniref:Uncharacterized protein n=1 Tax=Cladocopium goreaui TaxID=2562237 RepID=A0A9P1GLY1_9DINO|nr:unnamed protein product [Cladocopium goreaui]|mmetsp:Transcript_6371/g.14435  ORF Transcript_6371/g.14435 Transcript_6371/m.14435 type:complete len:210 (+) Transcript_6371:47-676(+)
MATPLSRKRAIPTVAATLLLLPMFPAFTGLPRQRILSRTIRQQSDRDGSETMIVTRENAKDDEAEVRRKRINGRVEKPLPKTMKVKEKAENTEMSMLGKGALALLGAALLAAALQLFGGEPDMPRDTYYISSSSYVIQSSRDATGQMRSRVDENSGVWTNIPGIKGSSGESPERARERLRSTEEQLDRSMQQMNREMEDAFQLFSLYPF